ncbi:MAG TPA: CPBP family intramembrane glutamic endopeptidase [Polyangiaceae bacterium]|nr:CPBP family intramembrane glutamic endopeptidase [Polyangiaceae bacterium]
MPVGAPSGAGLAAAAAELAPHPGVTLTPLPEISWWSALMNHPPVKALLPIPILVLIAPVILWFFRRTWDTVNAEAALERAAAGGRPDYRPAVCFSLTAVILTVQEYYGGRDFFGYTIRPLLVDLEAGGASFLRLARYDELYGYAWWVAARVIGYVVVPIAVWKVLFRGDRVLDMGLRVRGFMSHLWLYGLSLGVVLVAMFIVAREPDFGTYYPFYKLSSRSWSDFIAWEAMYFVQFFALEFFFRGWMLAALRPALGAAAIFAMAVPYCMIHYGKPYLEAHGALVAGVVLGSLAMQTRSIYAGFLVHVVVAFSMDFLALARRSALPTVFWPEA